MAWGQQPERSPEQADRYRLSNCPAVVGAGVAATARSSAPATSPRNWSTWARWSPPIMIVSANATISSQAPRPAAAG